MWQLLHSQRAEATLLSEVLRRANGAFGAKLLECRAPDGFETAIL
jgi:hypothetical protein